MAKLLEISTQKKDWICGFKAGNLQEASPCRWTTQLDDDLRAAWEFQEPKMAIFRGDFP